MLYIYIFKKFVPGLARLGALGALTRPWLARLGGCAPRRNRSWGLPEWGPPSAHWAHFEAARLPLSEVHVLCPASPFPRVVSCGVRSWSLSYRMSHAGFSIALSSPEGGCGSSESTLSSFHSIPSSPEGGCGSSESTLSSFHSIPSSPEVGCGSSESTLSSFEEVF